MLRRLAVVLSLILAGCDGDPEMDAGPAPETFRAECENVNPVHCLLPFPSQRYLEEDPSTATGLRISIPEAAMITDVRGRPVNPALFDRFDGFSPSTALVTSFPGPVDPSGLNGEDAIAETVSPSSTTVIVDAETGELVPHFAEIDGWDAADPDRAALYLRPIARFAENRRYVVGIHGLGYQGGAAVEPSAYFRALRDDEPLPGTDVDARRAGFEEAFGVLEAAGVARGELVESWWFTTGTDEPAYHDLLRMRDETVGFGDDPGSVGADGLGCTVTRVEDDPDNENIWRRVDGTVTVPLYLNGLDPQDPDESRLRRGADGEVEASGTAEVEFVLLIPRSVQAAVAAGGEPAPLEIYGHGLFGSREEVFSDWHEAHAERLGVVTVGINWWGMSEDDVPRVIETLRDMSRFDATGERLNQGVTNVLVLTRTVRGLCRDLPELQVELDAMGSGTAPAYADDAVHYYGNSLGGILGGSVAAVSNDIERFVLGVGGISFPLMVKRSSNWRFYGDLMAMGYPDALDRDLLMVASQPLWDIGEPATGGSRVVNDPFPNTIPKQVLMQIGIGDAEVPNVASELQARSLGIPLLTPSPRTEYGLETTDGPSPNAIVFYAIDGAPPAAPGTVDPGGANPAHEGVRRTPAAIDQIGEFTRNGVVVHMCDGPCDPE